MEGGHRTRGCPVFGRADWVHTQLIPRVWATLCCYLRGTCKHINIFTYMWIVIIRTPPPPPPPPTTTTTTTATATATTITTTVNNYNIYIGCWQAVCGLSSGVPIIHWYLDSVDKSNTCVCVSCVSQFVGSEHPNRINCVYNEHSLKQHLAPASLHPIILVCLVVRVQPQAL